MPGLHGTCVLIYTYEYASRRVQYAYVLYAQVKRCGCSVWCCGFRNPAFAPQGVDFGGRLEELRNTCVPRRSNALVSIFQGMKLMCTCAKKASQGRFNDIIPWRWREGEEDQQLDEEGEELPEQEKQPVLEEGAVAAAANAAAATAVIDIDTYLKTAKSF
eukprot:361176-Chlamydomonas_euryale.AAC.7